MAGGIEKETAEPGFSSQRKEGEEIDQNPREPGPECGAGQKKQPSDYMRRFCAGFIFPLILCCLLEIARIVHS